LIEFGPYSELYFHVSPDLVGKTMCVLFI